MNGVADSSFFTSRVVKISNNAQFTNRNLCTKEKQAAAIDQIQQTNCGMRRG